MSTSIQQATQRFVGSSRRFLFSASDFDEGAYAEGKSIAPPTHHIYIYVGPTYPSTSVRHAKGLSTVLLPLLLYCLDRKGPLTAINGIFMSIVQRERPSDTATVAYIGLL